jgi:hypothetical protein
MLQIFLLAKQSAYLLFNLLIIKLHFCYILKDAPMGYGLITPLTSFYLKVY